MKIKVNTKAIFIYNKENFDRFVTYIKILETVPISKCDRHHNKKPYSRGILPIARLCIECRDELSL